MENSVIQEIARAAPEVDIRTLSALMEAGISDPPTETENELLDYDVLLTLDGHAVWLEDGTCFIVCANYRRPNGERTMRVQQVEREDRPSSFGRMRRVSPESET